MKSAQQMVKPDTRLLKFLTDFKKVISPFVTLRASRHHGKICDL
jgi:hypothetical protein